MKRIKVFLTAFAVVAIVGSALAVKANFCVDSVYWASTCAANTRVDFRINPNGTQINPCCTTGGVENHSWIIDENNICAQNQLGAKYDVCGVGK